MNPVAEAAPGGRMRRGDSRVTECLDITALISAEGVISYVSPVVAVVLGRPADALVGQAVEHLVHRGDRAVLRQLLAEVGETSGGSLSAECRFRGPRGAWRRFAVSAANLLGVPGVASIVATFRALPGPTEVPDLRRLWSGAVDGPDHFVQFYETDEFLADSVARYVAEGLRAGEGCVVLATAKHREAIEARLRAMGADVRAARSNGAYIALDAGEVLATIMDGEMPDVERLTEVIGGVIARAGAGGRRVRAFGELVALLAAEGNVAAAVRLEDLWDALRDAREDLALFCAYPIRDFTGEARAAGLAEVCERHARVIPDESFTALASADERLRTVALLQQKARSLEDEIAERKRAQERLRAALVAQALAYEAANQRMYEFLSIASHELRTPLTTIKANLQILARAYRRRMAGDEVGSPPREALLLERSDRQVERLARLVEDMIDLARIRQDRLELRPEPCDLVAVVREEVDVQRQAHPERVIRLALPEGDGVAIPIVADPDRIGQALTNFLTNALKYSEAERPVEVRVAVDGARARVAVRDEGPGIPPEERERVWEMFHRVPGVEVQSGSGVGLGLGLHLTRTIVERHGGEVGVESAVGEGSTFWFALPIEQG